MERLEILLNESEIFNYFRTEGNVHKELQRVVYEIIISSLLCGLTPHQQKILKHTHFHQADPNDVGTVTAPTLLGRLIDDVCFQSMSVKDTLSTELYIYSPLEMTGINLESILSKHIALINEVWTKRKVATISYSNKHIRFELYLKKKKTEQPKDAQ